MQVGQMFVRGGLERGVPLLKSLAALFPLGTKMISSEIVFRVKVSLRATREGGGDQLLSAQ